MSTTEAIADVTRELRELAHLRYALNLRLAQLREGILPGSAFRVDQDLRDAIKHTVTVTPEVYP